MESLRRFPSPVGASFPQGGANFQQGIPRSGHFCNWSNGEEKAYIANFLI
jgi:hypothetical protein